MTGVVSWADDGCTAGSLYLICTAALGCEAYGSPDMGSRPSAAERRLAVSNSHTCHDLTTQLPNAA